MRGWGLINGVELSQASGLQAAKVVQVRTHVYIYYTHMYVYVYICVRSFVSGAAGTLHVSFDAVYMCMCAG